MYGINGVSVNYYITDKSLQFCIIKEYNLSAPEFIHQPSLIEEMRFDGKDIRSLEGLFNYPNLTKIDFSNNQIREFILHAPNKIKYINLSNNMLERVDISFLVSPCFVCDFRNNPQLKEIIVNENFQEGNLDKMIYRDSHTELKYK